MAQEGGRVMHQKKKTRLDTWPCSRHFSVGISVALTCTSQGFFTLAVFFSRKNVAPQWPHPDRATVIQRHFVRPASGWIIPTSLRRHWNDGNWIQGIISSHGHGLCADTAMGRCSPSRASQPLISWALRWKTWSMATLRWSKMACWKIHLLQSLNIIDISERRMFSYVFPLEPPFMVDFPLQRLTTEG